MKAKLIKTDVNYLLEDDKGVIIASTSTKEGNNKLSKQNCDEIFGVVDVEKLAYDKYPYEKSEMFTCFELDCKQEGYIEGFNKAMELNKDKVFTLEDMHEALHLMNNTPEVKISGEALDIVKKITEIRENIISKVLDSKKPTEIEVGIETETKVWEFISNGEFESFEIIPKLDSEGCLILKKI